MPFSVMLFGIAPYGTTHYSQMTKVNFESFELLP